MTEQQRVGSLTQVEKIDRNINREVASAITVGSGGIAFQNAGEVMEFARMMAVSGAAVPPHLRESPGACLGVLDDALRYRMSPYALARKSYFVNQVLCYEAQAIHAIILKWAPIADRPDIEYEGEGPNRVCVVTVQTLTGKTITHRSPKLADIKPQNSPLWKSDPDQQLSYYTNRAMARRHFPDIIMGMYDPEEAAAFDTPAAAKTVDGPNLAARLPGAGVAQGGYSANTVADMAGEPESAASDAAAQAQDAPPKRTRRTRAQIEADKAAEAAKADAVTVDPETGEITEDAGDKPAADAEPAQTIVTNGVAAEVIAEATEVWSEQRIARTINNLTEEIELCTSEQQLDSLLDDLGGDDHPRAVVQAIELATEKRRKAFKAASDYAEQQRQAKADAAASEEERRMQRFREDEARRNAENDRIYAETKAKAKPAEPERIKLDLATQEELINQLTDPIMEGQRSVQTIAELDELIATKWKPLLEKYELPTSEVDGMEKILARRRKWLAAEG